MTRVVMLAFGIISDLKFCLREKRGQKIERDPVADFFRFTAIDHFNLDQAGNIFHLLLAGGYYLQLYPRFLVRIILSATGKHKYHQVNSGNYNRKTAGIHNHRA